MNTLKIVSFFFFFTSFFSSSREAVRCSTAVCRRSNLVVRFPFRIKTFQAEPCGYGGFDLTCDDAGNATIVTLPFWGAFTVQEIYYASQELWINDPFNCLAKRILGLNLSMTPFRGVHYQSFSFFSCSTPDYLRYRPLNPIACLSDGNSTVFATSTHRVADDLSKSCRFMKIVSVPVQRSSHERMLSSDLSEDLRLSWQVPRCGPCETRGGSCGFKSNSSRDIVCSNAGQGLGRKAPYAIALGAGIPGALLLLGLLFLLCSSRRRLGPRSPQQQLNNSSIPPQANVITSGLDGPTLESYPKIVLGRSRRLPEPNDATCPICLSEYEPKETLKTIPWCRHCFHADCIDEWLRLNAMCPVCRSSPGNSPAGGTPDSRHLSV